jgi:hypothetical protein
MAAIWTRWLGRWTIILGVLALITAGIFYCTMQDARNAAKAAHDDSAAAELRSQSGLRAYVGYEGGTITMIDATHYTVKITIKNNGLTPAYAVRMAFNSKTGVPFTNSTWDKTQRALQPLWLGRDSVDLGPASPLTYSVRQSCGRIKIDGDDLQRVITGNRAIYVYGWIAYRDVFQKCQLRDVRLISAESSVDTRSGLREWKTQAFAGGISADRDCDAKTGTPIMPWDDVNRWLNTPGPQEDKNTCRQQ